MMLKKVLLIIGLVFLAARADAVVFNSNTMINITASPYSAVAASTTNILLNGSSAVWTNNSPGFDTLTSDSDHKDIDSLVNTAGTSESCSSNSITVSSGQLYLLAYVLTNNSGQSPTLTGTNGFPTTALMWSATGAPNYIGWVSTGTSLTLTLTNTAAANNILTFTLVTATDNTSAINSAISSAASAGQDVYVPPGLFVCNPSAQMGGQVRFLGQTAITDTWVTIPSTLLNVSTYTGSNSSPALISNGFKDIVVTYFSLNANSGNYTGALSSGEFIFKNSVYNAQPGVDYPINTSILEQYITNSRHINFIFKGSTFNANGNYELLAFGECGNVTINNSQFYGYSSQGPISFNAPPVGVKIVIKCNLIKGNGSTTGIFFPANRQWPCEDVVIENNKIYDIAQEAIALDGLGNEAGGCPTIANGPIASVTNDSSGRLVVGMADMLYYYSAANQAFSVSTWISQNPTYPLTNFYFTLGQGSGQEGVVAKIYSYSSANNTVTLNCFIPAASVTVGGDCGIQAGFFNFKIKGNGLENCGTAISLYLNCFGFDVEGNTAIGCNNGIQVVGGLMVSTYYTLIYNNLVQGNTFINCGSSAPYPSYPVNGAVSFFSDYTSRRQYGNRFVNNIVRGGSVNIASQGKFIWAGNQIDPGTPVNWTP